MTYYLSQKPDNYCPVEELERTLDLVLTNAEDDKGLLEDITQEVFDRRPEATDRIYQEAFKGVDIREDVDKLFEEVVEECLKENIDYFGG